MHCQSLNGTIKKYSTTHSFLQNQLYKQKRDLLLQLSL